MLAFGLLLAIAALGFVLGVFASENQWRKEMAADFSKLEASVAALDAKVTAYIGAQVPPVDVQPQIDQAQAAVDAITAKVPAV